MPKRGKVLRDPHLGPGLLMVEGKQYPFQMEDVWRSDIPAKPGLAVNVDFDRQGRPLVIIPVPQSQLDQEEAELTRSRSRVLLQGWGSTALARLCLVAVLAFSWFFLTAVSIHLPVVGKADLTFWQVLGYLNTGDSLQLLEVSGAPDSGALGFLAILVLAGATLASFWKDRRALLGGILPLSFMLLVAYQIDVSIRTLALQMNGPYAVLQTDPRYGISHVFSLGLGTYISGSVAIYLAVLSARQLMRSPQVREEPTGCSQRLAA